ARREPYKVSACQCRSHWVRKLGSEPLGKTKVWVSAVGIGIQAVKRHLARVTESALANHLRFAGVRTLWIYTDAGPPVLSAFRSNDLCQLRSREQLAS